MLAGLSVLDWIAILGSGFVVGLSKSGIKGIAILIVALMVFVFGAKASTGLVLPMLIVGDIFAVIYYNRHAQWKYLFRLIPFMMGGVILGTFVGENMPEETFREAMAAIILGSVIIMFWWDYRKSKKVPEHIGFAGIMGLTAGFVTMVGNLAGSFVNIFFLAMRLPKNEFIGTAAWLFLIVNLFKVPFHVLSWKTITWETLEVNLYLIPSILLGLYIGIKVIKRINEVFFRRFILVMTGLGAILIYFT